MFSSFLSPSARGAAKESSQDQREKTKKGPPEKLDIDKKATPDRWRPMIGAGDEEFKEIWDMFDKMRHHGEKRLGLDDILEKHFTRHEASLFIPADREKSPAIAYIQRQASRRYHKLVKTERFAGLKQASSAEVLISKLTMLYFGLPIAPYSFVSFDDQVAGQEDEDGITYDTVELVHPEHRPLKFLNKYTERSYGKDISRRPDPLYEMFYSGLSELQWAGHIPYEIPSFGQLSSMTTAGGPGPSAGTALRGGAGNAAELRGRKTRGVPVEDDYTWRMYGYQGQIVIGEDLSEFQSAVDRLLGFTERGRCMATLHRFNRTVGKVDTSLDFATGSNEEDEAFQLVRETPDPDQKKFSFFLTKPHEEPPDITNWFPAADNKNIVRVRASGKTGLNCAYIYLPHFERDYIGANDYESIFVAAARILFAPLGVTENIPAILPSVVGFAFAGEHDTPYNCSLGGLNISHYLVGVIQKRAKERKTRDLIMIRGPSIFEGEMGLFMPGITYDDRPATDDAAMGINTSERWKFSSYNSVGPGGEPAAEVLRKHIWTRFSPSELKQIHHVEIWAPGEAIMDPKSRPRSIMIDVVHVADRVTDNALDQLLKHAADQKPDDLVFFSAKPAYQSGHRVILLDKDGRWTRPEAIGNDKHPQCFSLRGEMTVERFRQKIRRAIVSKFDESHKDGAIFIQQSEKVWEKYEDMSPEDQRFIQHAAKLSGLRKGEFMAQLRAMMEAGRNNYVVHPHTTEDEWVIIKRFIISQDIYVHMIPLWSAPASQTTELFGCFMPLSGAAESKTAARIPGNGKGKDRNNGESTSDSRDLIEVVGDRHLGEFALDPNFQSVPSALESAGSQKRTSRLNESLSAQSNSRQTSRITMQNTIQNTTQRRIQGTTETSPALDGKVVPFGPPTIQGKWPLTNAERVKFLREQTYGNPISIYDGGRPHIPINAPPLEKFLHGGAGLPSVSIAMMTLTEQRHLQEQYLQMRNVALERTMPCPYRPCGHSFSVDKLDALRAHIEASHASDSCNFCDERLYKYWGTEKRLHHFNTKHSNMLSVADTAAVLSVTMGEKPAQRDKGKKAVSFQGPENPTIVITKPTKDAATKSKPAGAARGTPQRSPVPGQTQRQVHKSLKPSTENANSSGGKGKRTAAPNNNGDIEHLDDGIEDDDYDMEYDEEYEEEEDDEDYTEKPRTPKPGRSNASGGASDNRDSTPASSTKRKRSGNKWKTGEKDSTYRDGGDIDDHDSEPVAELCIVPPESSRGKKQKVSHPDPDSDDTEWIDSGHSDDSSISSQDEEPNTSGTARRREAFRLRAENDPSWKPRKGSHANDDDDPELEASAVPEGDDSVLADIQGGTEAGSAAKKRGTPADPSYRLPKDAPGEDDDPALIRSAVPEPGLPGILMETPTKKRKLPTDSGKSAAAVPGGANLEVALHEKTVSRDAEPVPKKARRTPAAKKTAAARKTPAKAKATPAAKSTANKPAAEEDAVDEPALVTKSTAKPKPTPARRKPLAEGDPVRRSTRTVSKEIQ
ncbi:hypothetical protein PpBr36_02772 [Pyricularia pennisetigena]|uniref:hypothetical protein n=1 Tax=Pyricularia pennisetigena TaxID=1578925 RepID=UPI0011536D4E|nr:hypothetical protein PpBr36_02772 [Pyricularia pennisetigena]TLS30725.1 hypothetical protein PpBr36_02772 [Pyricularia pennisetigena]